MKLNGLRLRKSLVIAILVCSASVICYGQEIQNTIVPQSSRNHVQDSETAKQLEIALIKLDGAEKREVLLNQRLGEKDIVIKAREDLIAAKQEVIDLMKLNRADSDKIDTGDARVLARCDKQVQTAEARIKFLEHPPILARLFNPDVIIAGVFGYGLGRWTAPKQGPIQITNPFSQFSNVAQGQFLLYQDSDRIKDAMKKFNLK